MSFEHNQMAHAASRALLESLRGGAADWAPTDRLTATSTYWQGVVDWPRPDQAFQDSTTGASLAVEFKPPGHSKAEYVRGLGQSVTYLEKFEMASLVMPQLATDGFPIADFVAELLRSTFSVALPIGLLDYSTDPEVLRTVVPVRRRTDEPPPIPRGSRKVFWAYWRDLSQFDLFALLHRMDQRSSPFSTAFHWFWKQRRAKGRALTWEGKARKANPVGSRFEKSEKINTELSLRHSGLIDSSGRLTEEALDLLRLGKVYGPASAAFRFQLGHVVLTMGRHLELIFWVADAQATMSDQAKRSSQEFLSNLDSALEEAGIIGTDRPGAKPTFLRDEPKRWNKLGLLSRSTGDRYFFPGEGFRFDWRTITAMANSGS